MENTNTNDQASRVQLINDVKTTTAAYYALKDKDTTTIAALNVASKAKDVALTALNADALAEAYASALVTDAPVASLCRAQFYPKWYTRKTKSGIECVTREERLNVVDFIAYCQDEDEPRDLKGADVEKISASISTIADAMKERVTADITTEKGGQTKAAKEALDVMAVAMGIEDVHACSKDVRFMGYAVTTAHAMCKLDTITAETVTPYIMDFFRGKLRGEAYAVEARK